VAESRRLVYNLFKNKWKTDKAYTRIIINRFSGGGHDNVK
jgi:hypothetical protein